MASAQKRIAKELSDLNSTPIDNIEVSLASESDLHTWTVKATGPESSPYAGGVFTIALILPTDYPFKPPTLNFTTKIYHPNVSNDDKGNMCLGLLRPDKWKPNCKIADVLRFMMQLLSEPETDDAIEQATAREYIDNRPAFEKKAREWTDKYAKGKTEEKAKSRRK